MSIMLHVFREMLKDNIAPRLRDKGFKGSGGTFRKNIEQGTQIVNFQKSSGNTSQLVKFTINVGVYFPNVHPMFNLDDPVSTPKEIDCILRSRIGELKSEGQDKWWELSANTDVSAMSDDVWIDLFEFGIKWLDRCSSLEAAMNELVNRKKYKYASALAIHLDMFDLAKQHLKSSLNRSPHAEKHLRKFGNKYGLLDS